MGDSQKEKGATESWVAKFKMPAIALAVIAVAGFLAFNYLGLENPTGLVTAPLPEPETTANATAEATDSIDVSPMEYAVRQRYFEEVFRPKRDKYDLFEKAAAYLNIPMEDTLEYFSLRNEEEIFADLPPIADDFSEIAYLFANGRYFAIGYLDETYYKHPEFYPGFKEIGLSYWAEPNPKYWTPHGYGSYPAEQWTTLKKGENEEFTAVVFFYTSWGVQTWQGVTLMPDSESLKDFDIRISPQNFLLEATFPKFYEDWAHKIVIMGKLRPDTLPGSYTIAINIEKPPADLRLKWELEHRNMYFDAMASGIAPEGNQIQFNIMVE